MLSELIRFSAVDFSSFDHGVETAAVNSRVLTFQDELFHVRVFLVLTEVLSRVYVFHRIIVSDIAIIKVLNFLFDWRQIYFFAEFFEHT